MCEHVIHTRDWTERSLCFWFPLAARCNWWRWWMIWEIQAPEHSSSASVCDCNTQKLVIGRAVDSLRSSSRERGAASKSHKTLTLLVCVYMGKYTRWLSGEGATAPASSSVAERHKRLAQRHLNRKLWNWVPKRLSPRPFVRMHVCTRMHFPVLVPLNESSRQACPLW